MSTDADAWRGVAAEQADDITAGLAELLRSRSRRLLGDLLRPHRREVIITITLIVIESLAALAGPWLVGLAIDNGLPPLLHARNPAPLLTLAAAFAIAVAVQAVTTRMFVSMTGRVGQQVVLELRNRLFAHNQALDVAFHESYTSGRVISRQTSDIESISDLFEEGLDSLIAAVLTLVLVGTGMLLLDWRLGLVVLGGFIPLAWLTTWFRRGSARAYRRTRDTIALVIVQFVETFGGIRAVQAFRREPRNAALFSRQGQDYADASRDAARLYAIFGPSVSLVGNVITGRDPGLRRPAGHRRRHPGRRTGHVPAVPAALLRPAGGRVAVLQHVPVGGLRPGEDLRRCSSRSPRCPSPASPAALPARSGGLGRAAGPVRERHLRLPGQPRAARSGPGHPGRPDGGAGGRDRRGQDDHRPAAGPVLRPALGPGHPGRDRPAAAARPGPAVRGHRHHPGELPVRRVGGGQHQAGSPGCL